MSKNILISVIIPVYKAEKYLPRCIESVLNQTYKNFELILVDDGSPDNSGKICDEYALKDNRIKVIHKENGGVSSARNAGINIAKGQFINFVDSDDYVPQDSLENLINIQKKNDVDFVCCTFERHYNNGTINVLEFFNTFIDFNKIAIKDCYILLSTVLRGPCAKLFKNSILKENSILYNEKIKIAEDSIFVFEYMTKCNSIECADINVYKYIANEESATTKRYEDFYKFIILDVTTRIEFFSTLNLTKLTKTGVFCCCILAGVDFIIRHYLYHFNYDKTVMAVNKFYNHFKSIFIKNDEIEKILLNSPRGKNSVKNYKLLISKNGVKKLCKYKFRQKKFNDFKAKLKKIKLINKLYNLIKIKQKK